MHHWSRAPWRVAPAFAPRGARALPAFQVCAPFAAAHGNLGNLLRDVKKDYDGAEQEYRTAIRLDPELEHAHRNLGALLEDGANMNRTQTFDGGL